MPMPRRVWRKCAVPDCPAESRSNIGYCVKHYARWKRHGDPLVCLVPRPPEQERLGSNGYLKCRRPEHPTADGKGETYVHRYVLYEKIGPGWHPCYFCGRLVSWDRRYPGDEDGLTVEHIDHVKTNNDPVNLAPCCGYCNLQEGRKWFAARGSLTENRSHA